MNSLGLFCPKQDLPHLQDMTIAQFKSRNPALNNVLPIQQWEWRKNLRNSLTVTILVVDRGAQILAVKAGDLLAHTLRLNLLQMNLDGSRGRFEILDPVSLDVFTGKVKRTLKDQTGIRNPPLAVQRPLFPALGVARVRAGRPRGGQVDSPAAEFIWNADVLAGTDTGLAIEPILDLAEQIRPASLTERQRDAIARAVSRRLALGGDRPAQARAARRRPILPRSRFRQLPKNGHCGSPSLVSPGSLSTT